MQSVDPAVADATLHAGAGNYLSEDDVTSMKIEKLADGREAYVYEVYAPYAQHGGHILASFTVKVGPGRTACTLLIGLLMQRILFLRLARRQCLMLWSRGSSWFAERKEGIL